MYKAIKKYKQGGIAVDPLGYYNPKNKGKKVIIPDNHITMKGLSEPIIGTDNLGNSKLMQPNEDYVFPGSHVLETPLMQMGGLSRFDLEKKAVLDEKLRQQKLANLPSISQYTPKEGDQERMDANRAAYKQEEAKPFNQMASSKLASNAMENIVEPMADVAMAMEGAGLAGKGLKQAGKFLTEKTALKQATTNITKPYLENELVDLYRVQDKNFDINVNTVASLDKAATEGKLGIAQKSMITNPYNRQRLIDRDKFYGQWFEKDPNRLKYYIDDKGPDSEILHIKVPKSEAPQYSIKNFEPQEPVQGSPFKYHEKMSLSPETEFVLPKDIIQNANKYPVSEWERLIKEHKPWMGILPLAGVGAATTKMQSGGFQPIQKVKPIGYTRTTADYVDDFDRKVEANTIQGNTQDVFADMPKPIPTMDLSTPKNIGDSMESFQADPAKWVKDHPLDLKNNQVDNKKSILGSYPSDPYTKVKDNMQKNEDYSYIPSLVNGVLGSIGNSMERNRQNEYTRNNLANPFNYLPINNNTNSYVNKGVQMAQEGGEIDNTDDENDDMNWDFDIKEQEQPQQVDESPYLAEQLAAQQDIQDEPIFIPEEDDMSNSDAVSTSNSSNSATPNPSNQPGMYGKQIDEELTNDLGYKPEYNSVFRTPEEQEKLIKQGFGVKNSFHLTGDAIDLKPKDWYKLDKTNQDKYRAKYDVVFHNNHFHIEPKGHPKQTFEEKYQQYSTPEEGKQALLNQLDLYQSGKSKSGILPNDNLLNWASKYAPTSDGNDPVKYANFVADKLGVSVNIPISKLNKLQWAEAITKMEGNTKGNNPGNIKR